MGGGLAVDPPVAAAIGLKPGMPDTRRGLPGDPRAARRPGLIHLNRVTDHPGLAVLGSGGASAEVIAAAGCPEPGNLESLPGLAVLPGGGHGQRAEGHTARQRPRSPARCCDETAAVSDVRTRPVLRDLEPGLSGPTSSLRGECPASGRCPPAPRKG